MARQIHILVVGKLKDSNLEAIENNYLKRITNPPLVIHEIKASAENKEAEGEAILKKIRELGQTGAVQVVALSEWGKKVDSIAFAEWTRQLLDQNSKLILIISGAEGFSDEVLKSCQDKISLSPLTFPHKIARVILVEQLYRAQTIRTGHPYHN